MAKKISALDELLILSGDEYVPIAINGQNYRFKISAVRALIDKASLGLGNVDNTSDANKPISNAVGQALNQKAPLTHQHAITDVTGLEQALLTKSGTGHHHIVAEIDDFRDNIDVSVGNLEW